MGYRITYSQKKSKRAFHTHRIRLLLLTALFFLLFCAYTSQKHPEYTDILHLLLSKARILIGNLTNSIVLWSESPGPL